MTIHEELMTYKKKYLSLSCKTNLKGKGALAEVERDGYALRHVEKQTKAICLAAVKQNGYALQYVEEQNEAICLEAVKQDGCALQYVGEQMFD